MENPFNTEETKPQRSTLLTVLLILTFIWSGLTFIGNAYISISFDAVLGLMDEAVDESFAPFIEQALGTLEKAGPLYFALLAFLALASISGAALMLKLNKLGFHIYAAAQVIMLFVPMVAGLAKFPGLFETGITALFIWLYARELKVIGK